MRRTKRAQSKGREKERRRTAEGIKGLPDPRATADLRDAFRLREVDESRKERELYQAIEELLRFWREKKMMIETSFSFWEKETELKDDLIFLTSLRTPHGKRYPKQPLFSV